jgi:hypothetical protein
VARNNVSIPTSDMSPTRHSSEDFEIGDSWHQAFFGPHRPGPPRNWNNSMPITGYIFWDGIIVSKTIIQDYKTTDCRYVAPTGTGAHYVSCCNSHWHAAHAYDANCYQTTTATQTNTNPYVTLTECNNEITFKSPVSDHTQILLETALQQDSQIPFTQGRRVWISGKLTERNPHGVFTFFPCEIPNEDCKAAHSKAAEKLSQRDQGNWAGFTDIQEVMSLRRPVCYTSGSGEFPIKSLVSTESSTIESLLLAHTDFKCLISAESVKVHHSAVTRDVNSNYNVCPLSTRWQSPLDQTGYIYNTRSK